MSSSVLMVVGVGVVSYDMYSCMLMRMCHDMTYISTRDQP